MSDENAMMPERYEIEVVRKVYDNVAGGFISVGPDTDGLGLIEVIPGDYGNGYIRLPREMASQLAQALWSAANDRGA